jgi:protocatechuate 3,4-dioxygenase beta subunit
VARHIHYFVTAPGYLLSTQLYFATDEVFGGDVDRNYTKDPLITSRSLVRPVTLASSPEAPTASVEFDIVLEKARAL